MLTYRQQENNENETNAVKRILHFYYHIFLGEKLHPLFKSYMTILLSRHYETL